ncbi:hypothetical protein [Spirosoma flavus]
MRKRYVIATLFFSTLSLISVAQPSITPAPGYVWQAVSSSTYTTGPQRTGCKSGTGSCGTNDSSFGLNIKCPPDLPSTIVSGCPIIQKQIFGNVGESGSNFSSLTVSQNPGCGGTTSGSNWPSSSAATRRVTLTEWTNPNPESSVPNGASTGTVCLPTAARIVIDDGSVCDGSGIGAGELRFLVIGGNSGGQSSFNITANYQLNWSASKYGGSGSTGNQTVTQNLVVNDAGSGNQYDWALQQPNQSWYYPSAGNNVASFGTALQQTSTVPAGSVSQTGGTFTIDFTATASIDLGRAFGNADARVTMGPGFHGRARYEVDYQCWQIVPNPLPVRLVSFNAKAGDGLINVVWETAIEQNNSHFFIERSADAFTFEAIGQEAGKGTTSSRQQYVFVDKSPLSGDNYYRLRQVDMDGSTTYSKTVGVVYKETQPLLDVLGNPTEAQPIRIRLKNVRPENLRLTQQNGQSITFDLQAESGTTFRIVPKIALSSGVYLLTLREGSVRLSQRVVLK